MNWLCSICVIIILASFIMSASDFMPKRNWFRRVFTVSKVHQIAVSVITFLILFIFCELTLNWWISLMLLTLFIAINNLRSIRPYLPGSPKSVKDGNRSDIEILALNVRQKNSDYEKAKQTITSTDADVVVLTETNGEWTKSLLELNTIYPFHVSVPLENTYGMLLLSKFEINKYRIDYLVSEEVPSIHADLLCPQGKVHLILIHPEPPMDFSRLKDKDLEILKVQLLADEKDLPVVLCGDLNDVGWSYASMHLCEQSQLKDPRIGRGLFNTYNAHIPLFRYPIDHFFISKHFKVREMKVLPACGSDHFPVSIKLQLGE